MNCLAFCCVLFYSYSQFHPERKRKSDLSDPRVHKDPRLEGHGYPESGYSESSNDSQLKH